MNSRAKKLSLFTFAVFSLGAFTGCVDNDYDLDGVDIPQFGIRIVHKKVGSLTNILYLYR